jgi:hypothetical protein
VVVTAAGGQAKPLDSRQLLDCKATRSVYRVDLHTPDAVRCIRLRGQRVARVGHRVIRAAVNLAPVVPPSRLFSF